MPAPLLVSNPSTYLRKGYVTTLWQPIYERTGILPNELVVFDRDGRQLLAQVDRIDPNDPARDVLVFRLEEDIPPVSDDHSRPATFVIVDSGKPDAFVQTESQLTIVGAQGRESQVRLRNRLLEIVFNLSPAPWNDERNWYAGSASSVELDGKEILDAFRAEIDWIGHDPEKRCMQIDRIQLSRPPWEPAPSQQIDLFNQPYYLIAVSRGPVRVSATVASEPFAYHSTPPGTGTVSLTCQLYRVISLYEDADYIMEELYVKGVPNESSGTAEPIHLYFTARYFTYMDLGLDIDISQFAHSRSWFALECSWPPYQGYGFATDASVGPVANPHPGYPAVGSEYKSFSWELSRTQSAKCLHLFSRAESKVLENRVGQVWYDLVYKPLSARIGI